MLARGQCDNSRDLGGDPKNNECAAVDAPVVDAIGSITRKPTLRARMSLLCYQVCYALLVHARTSFT